MHHLHFRYVSEEPRSQTLRRLFQLLDDMPPDLRHDLLRNLFIDFRVFSELLNEKDKQAAEYTELKSKLQRLVGSVPGEQAIVYGLVCFVLGNVHARCTIRLPRLIDQKRRLVQDGLHSELESLNSLREEEGVLRNAYATFCELVIGPLLGDVQTMDFGSEWLFDDSEPVPPDQVKAALAKQQSASAISEHSEPIISSFLDQVAAQFEVALRIGPETLALRVEDKAVSVSVGEYCAPCDRHPTRPRVLRLNISGVSLLDRAFRQLGLPVNPKYHLKCRLEFSVLPAELPRLSSWTAEWVRGQALQSQNGPPIPIVLDGGEASFSASCSDWLSVDYLWSSAAREAYKTWENTNERG